MHKYTKSQPDSRQPRENPFLALKHRTRLVFLRGKPFQDLSFARIRFATLSLLSLSFSPVLSLSLRAQPPPPPSYSCLPKKYARKKQTVFSTSCHFCPGLRYGILNGTFCKPSHAKIIIFFFLFICLRTV